MSAEAYREEEIYSETGPKIINIKRNPYLVDYEQQRGLGKPRETLRKVQDNTWEEEVRRVSQRASRREQEMQRGREVRRAPRRVSQREQEMQWEQEVRRAPRRVSQREQEMQWEREVRPAPRRVSQREQEMQWEREVRPAPRRVPQREQEMQRSREAGRGPRRAPQRIPGTEEGRRGSGDLHSDEPMLSQAQRKRAAMEKKRAAARRRRIARMQRMVLLAGGFCITLLCGILYMKRIDAKTVEPGKTETQQKVPDDVTPAVSSSNLVQGLPASKFAGHPEWEENFLTPNEYSRPGDALEAVNSIFVHYTANPNTSAAQNRSYFEQLKDTHITSASAHFIIGYNGEIVQCIPLDEIAYAVQTRNFDSISIECCYKSANGSFTQETYDSLIELLAWLTDVYDLTPDDILRHYDCGGKKCPIYYTENEDAWERLKKDVGEKL